MNEFVQFRCGNMLPSMRSSEACCGLLLRGGRSLLFTWLMLIVISNAEAQRSPSTLGDPTCPCLVGGNVPRIAPADLTPTLINALGFSNTNSTEPDSLSVYTYGTDGCGPHDADTWMCQSIECLDDINGVPCDRSWCNRSFCYVDPLKCNLTSRRSAFFRNSNRYYSYATCNDVDSFSSQNLIAALDGKTFRTGFCSNSGGWTGSYNTNGGSFEGQMNDWTGPLDNFARLGAMMGGFQLELAAPPEVLYNKSMEYFNTTSKFDYCVFAVALGYLDLCVGEFTMTDLRVSTADFLDISADPLYLIVQVQAKKSVSIFTIFAPFHFTTWIFIVFGVIPGLAMILLMTEYHHPASVFPTYEEVDAFDRGHDNGDDDEKLTTKEAQSISDLSGTTAVTVSRSWHQRRRRHQQGKDGSRSQISIHDINRVESSLAAAPLEEPRHDLSLDDKQHMGSGSISQALAQDQRRDQRSTKRRIPFLLHLVRSMNMSLLSLLEGGFGGTVVTPGGKLTVLAINFFVLVTIAVYTANLAAILTQKAQSTSVANFEDALDRHYRFCAARNRVEALLKVYNVPDDILVKHDPEDGGDGLPGFVERRDLVFDRLDLAKALAGDQRYCHAALSVAQDLDVLQKQGDHCNKTAIGQPLVYIRTGMPFSELISRSAIAFYRTMKNQGLLDKEYRAAAPHDRCKIAQSDDNNDGTSITVAQLSGLWMVTFGLAFAGVLLNLFRYLNDYLRPQRSGQIVRKFGTDQWCNSVEMKEH